MAEYDECRTCGAVVETLSKHKRWHKALETQLDELRGLIDDVEQKADQSANILYNRGLD